VAVTAADVPGERARALYFLGRCAERIGEERNDAGARQKAGLYYKEVVERYPGTRWARLAEQSLP
jgi:TolA-binding protein